MLAIAEAEEADDKPPEITEADLKRVERETLIDPANLQIFLTWYQFGGPDHGLSPMEAAAMPAAMRQDFMLCLKYLGQARRQVRNRKKATKARHAEF